MLPRSLVLLVLMVLVAVVAGCVQPLGPHPLPSPNAAQPLMKTEDYRVGTTDVIHIEVRGQPDLSQTVVIRPDGKITLSLLKDVYISGMTSAEIDEKLSRLYKEYIVGADLTVSIVGFNSKQIYIFGQVGRAGPMPFEGEMTILEAIAKAGDVLPRGEPKAIQLVRDGKVWKIDMEQIVLYGRTDQNVYLKEGDIIYVPLGGFARFGFALDNIFFPVRSVFSFIFLYDAAEDLWKKHGWWPH
jgi:polysaccharide export outer membrane protein